MQRLNFCFRLLEKWASLYEGRFFLIRAIQDNHQKDESITFDNVLLPKYTAT